MKYQTLKTIAKNFRAHLKTSAVKPKYCKTYGTKYPGSLSLSSFILYAMIRGKSPESCSHDTTGEKYLESMNKVKSFLSSDSNDKSNSQLINPFIGNGVTEEDIKNIVKNVD